MNRAVPQEYFENAIYEEIHIGQSARTVRTLTREDINAFAAVSGDTNPAHLDPVYADATLFHGVIAHGMWGGALISALLGTVFPGPGTIYLEQALHFSKPVRVGDTLTVTVTVTAKEDDKKRLDLDCQVLNQKGERVLHGMARVMAPTQKIRRPRYDAPHIQLFDPEARLRALLGMGDGLAAIRCGIVHPCDVESLRGAIKSAQLGLIDPVLIGPEAKLREIAEEANIDLGGVDIESVPHSHAAACKASEMAAARQVEALMKGSLHTDELIGAVLATTALRTARRMSHVFRFDVPTYHKPLLLTDAALNIHPTLEHKADIVQNAVQFARIMGTALPKVAILSAVETVNPNIVSTLDAAALCKMADRGQISGGLLDGPLAFDNAISPLAAQTKHIDSKVAGDADILVVPDLESGNMLAKQLEYLAGATASGIVLGARVPIALTSRADGASARVASALLAKLIAHHNRMIQP
ncbi:MAG TPA: bifunctional enoyl-CoA hydratase/phosphate acetyltransferase [Polaromonas sp.]|jgi:phosphate acetyltransferase|uniref:bifunctional enoyl-CoA hydratase/phosphate acetyltransferase n=1 Tax=unclassified Polaromonas TaxID=2638319 RepID=UPI000BCC5D11|nr:MULTISPECIES: bifunctional enoyl-CoA hydratase/phosphate acetyltransferase [unclassified Polaromonas]OYY32531.1 MAG: enoyl-CoA hydratase [Polaromonas sp. 35-63-35]OYZ14942.1 MAG: enoyl-CoA hydratase [Polaromonas sp. 16-63-31]OYZ75780.1 MAG: enoyl-CoA hydratase [Polaromonas sp. 24-63-21]OZA46919.1 MAG: enoyl-CoA hydratase [Polaromonas sp. 17-63-33]HQS00359.1 bifunctional enoyl-CoA hydratase/phosphate acetyltransferase [Polaromonas sp.]